MNSTSATEKAKTDWYTYVVGTYYSYNGTYNNIGGAGGTIIIQSGTGVATASSVVWTIKLPSQQVGQQCDPPIDLQQDLPFGDKVETPKTKSEGMSCASCSVFNDYAEPNQENSSFVCYACSHNL